MTTGYAENGLYQLDRLETTSDKVTFEESYKREYIIRNQGRAFQDREQKMQIPWGGGESGVAQKQPGDPVEWGR